MKKVRFKSLLSMALILMIVFSFPSGVFAETVAEEPATAEESEIIEAAEEETEDYLLTEEPEGEEVVPEEQTEEMILEEEAEESAATEDQEAGAEAEETVASVLPDAEQIPDGLDLDEAAILPEEAETEAAVKPGEMLPEAVKPTDGSAYAVLDDNYDLIFSAVSTPTPTAPKQQRWTSMATHTKAKSMMYLILSIRLTESSTVLPDAPQGTSSGGSGSQTTRRSSLVLRTERTEGGDSMAAA